jgi:hypothetical protein
MGHTHFQPFRCGNPLGKSIEIRGNPVNTSNDDSGAGQTWSRWADSGGKEKDLLQKKEKIAFITIAYSFYARA